MNWKQPVFQPWFFCINDKLCKQPHSLANMFVASVSVTVTRHLYMWLLYTMRSSCLIMSSDIVISDDGHHRNTWSTDCFGYVNQNGGFRAPRSFLVNCRVLVSLRTMYVLTCLSRVFPFLFTTTFYCMRWNTSSPVTECLLQVLATLHDR